MLYRGLRLSWPRKRPLLYKEPKCHLNGAVAFSQTLCENGCLPINTCPRGGLLVRCLSAQLGFKCVDNQQLHSVCRQIMHMLVSDSCFHCSWDLYRLSALRDRRAVESAPILRRYVVGRVIGPANRMQLRLCARAFADRVTDAGGNSEAVPGGGVLCVLGLRCKTHASIDLERCNLHRSLVAHCSDSCHGETCGLTRAAVRRTELPRRRAKGQPLGLWLHC